jgi:type II secretory pathway component PulF
MAIIEAISAQEKVDFVKNLSLLIRSGKPINESFELLSKQARSSTMIKTLKTAQHKIERGSSISDTFESFPYFGKVFVSFIRAGEESGTLDENLNNLAEWLERDSTLKKEISSATLYPKIIVVFAVVLGGALSVFVLPQLVPIFGTLDVNLPLSTRILLFVSDLMRDSALYVFGGLGCLLISLFFLFKLKPIKRWWHGAILKMPVVGVITKEYQLTIISQLITTLFRSGLTINNSLDIIANSVTNIRYREALDKIKERVGKGTGFSETMSEFPHLFPGIFVSIVATGEQTGSYSDSFKYLADFFASRVTERTKKLPTVLEPILLIAIGVFVAFIASAIIMPIYEVTKGLY